jgi:CRISPR system Cascade subunit CasD
MQSWGTRSRFQERDTEREPTKSGIIGLICAALGRDRSEPLNDLTSLKMGVRVDREGLVQSDFHTALDVIYADGSAKGTQLSRRAYLADAAFLVGLEGENRELLETVFGKLKNPVWPIFLGRKSFLPSPSVYLNDGFKEMTLIEALTQYPPIAPKNRQKPSEKWRIVLETNDSNTGDSRWDQPASFDFEHRKFHQRFVKTEWILYPGEPS